MFGRTKQPTVGDYVDVVREQAIAYAPKAQKQAQVAADAAASAARTYGPVARERAAEAYVRLDPYLQQARRRAQPYVDRAIDTAAPRVQRAVDGLEPQVDKARDAIVDTWLPRVSAGVAALAATTMAAKSQALAVSERAPDAVAVLKGDKVAKTPRGGKILIGLGVVAAVGAVVVVLANRKPKDDPWATPSTSYTPPAKTFTDRVAGAKDTVSSAAGTAAHKVSDAAGTAAHKAGDLADKAKDAAGDATDKAKSAVGKAGDAASDGTDAAGDAAKGAGTETIDVLGDVAEATKEATTDTAADVAGAASDVKPDGNADVSKGTSRARSHVDDAT